MLTTNLFLHIKQTCLGITPKQTVAPEPSPSQNQAVCDSLKNRWPSPT